MNIRKCLPAVAGFFIAATAFAVQLTLPTPPQSEYADAESSVNVPLPASDRRFLRLTFGFEPSPTNAVQVALGRDANADGDLAPEETALRVGCDCGVWFAHSESKSEGERKSGSDEGVASTLSIVLPAAECQQFAKVTTHNVDASNVTVTAKFFNRAAAIIVR